MSELFSSTWPYLAALLPSAGLLYLFYLVMKHILEGDRRERLAHSQWEREHGMSDHPMPHPLPTAPSLIQQNSTGGPGSTDSDKT